MANLPIRRAQFKGAEFASWLARNGAEVGAPTNPYEVIRYRAFVPGARKVSTHIVYSKENGLLSYTGASREHYEAFLAGGDLGARPVTENPMAVLNKGPSIPKQSKGDVTRAKLLARDGDECWFCGLAMGDDTTIEHLVPKSKRGANALDNYALAHQACNAKAADLPLVRKIELRNLMRDQANAVIDTAVRSKLIAAGLIDEDEK